MTTLDDIVHLPMKYKRHRYFIGRRFPCGEDDYTVEEMGYLFLTNNTTMKFAFSFDVLGDCEVFTYKDALSWCIKLAKASGVTHYICEVATAYHYPDVKYGRAPVPVTSRGVKKT